MTNPVMVTRTEVRDDPKVIVCLAHWVWCPACDQAHRFRTAIPDGENQPPIWGWDGNATEPTFEGSMLVRMGPAAPGGTDRVCHSFLKAGVWDFLSDCTHALAGQKVPMVPVPDWMVP